MAQAGSGIAAGSVGEAKGLTGVEKNRREEDVEKVSEQPCGLDALVGEVLSRAPPWIAPWGMVAVDELEGVDELKGGCTAAGADGRARRASETQP